MSNIANILRNAGGKSVLIGDCNINQNDKDVKVSLSLLCSGYLTSNGYDL